jgi:hypothetical protein
MVYCLSDARKTEPMKKIYIMLPIALVLAIGACAAHPDPIIDMKGVDPNVFAQDWKDCEAYTDEIVIGKGIAKGGATGAVVGAIGGAIDGDAGDGAAVGALYGGTRSGLDADREKQQVFKRCLRGRGYRVLN